ncbi:hypothetical protein GHH_c33340 [Geobacillus sp. GHH01]|nr:hypothetical protein GHH_c33340 [Geobacillus sp. GHH01]
MFVCIIVMKEEMLLPHSVSSVQNFATPSRDPFRLLPNRTNPSFFNGLRKDCLKANSVGFFPRCFRENARVLMGHFHAQVKGKGCSWIFSVSNGIGATFIACVLSFTVVFAAFPALSTFLPSASAAFPTGFPSFFSCAFVFLPPWSSASFRGGR